LSPAVRVAQPAAPPIRAARRQRPGQTREGPVFRKAVPVRWARSFIVLPNAPRCTTWARSLRGRLKPTRDGLSSGLGQPQSDGAKWLPLGRYAEIGGGALVAGLRKGRKEEGAQSFLGGNRAGATWWRTPCRPTSRATAQSSTPRAPAACFVRLGVSRSRYLARLARGKHDHRCLEAGPGDWDELTRKLSASCLPESSPSRLPRGRRTPTPECYRPRGHGLAQGQGTFQHVPLDRALEESCGTCAAGATCCV